MSVLVIDGGPLSVEDVESVARHGRQVTLAEQAVERMTSSRHAIDDAVARGDAVYGVTTGFGALADVRISDEDLGRLQLSLLRSHAAGVGPPLDDEIVRAMLLLRARTLAQGHSGVRPEIAQMLIEFLNRGLHPLIPEQGSVGASGDLAQLAHLALPLIGEGRARFEEREMAGGEALAAAGLHPLELLPKEGLSLLNGTEAMLAVGCLAMIDAQRLADAADVVCAMSVEALLGTDSAYQERLHRLRPHPGQLESALRLRGFLQGSEIVASHRDSPHAVQDAYSLRCAPQVHGACRDVLAYARGVFTIEAGSVTDNPLVFEGGEVLSAGNFHGEPLGFALDFMAAALCELSSISERRTDRMLDPDRSSGLPAFLSADPGTNSGYMLGQYTQAALVAESRLLSSPATVDTIPTSGLQEDHVSMGWNAALKLRKVVRNTAYVLAVEALCAAQGIELRAPLKPAKRTAAALNKIREVAPHLTVDRELRPEFEDAAAMILRGDLGSDEPHI